MSDKTIMNIMRPAARIAVGLMLVAAAIMKLVTIDSFEVYIYSFNISSYILTTILSRLIIAIELLLGLSLVFKVQYKIAWYFSLLLMVFFTIFLTYTIIYRDDSNCHCFGDIIDLNPSESIIKNIIAIILLVIAYDKHWRCYGKNFRRWLPGLILAASVIIPFVIVPNDIIYNKIYSEEEDINTVAFYKSLSDSTYIGYLEITPEKFGDSIVYTDKNQFLDISEGRYMLNYALAGCKYCKIGAERLTIMFDRHGISHDRLKFIIGGRPLSMSRFITMTRTQDYDHWKIGQQNMMQITYGMFPLYVMVEDGVIVKVMDFRHLEENEIVSFLSSDNTK